MPERIDELILGNFKIIQNTDEFCFSLDAVLLAHFPILKNKMKIMDLGTGTGVIPLVLMARKREIEKIVGIEYQPQMVEMARRSVELNGLSYKVSIQEGDIKELTRHIKDKFDLVTCNPPYKPMGEGKISPKESIAIARHEMLITLPEIVSNASKILKHGGKLAMVHLAERMTDLLYFFRANKLEPKRLRLIHPMPGKPANLLLLEGVLGAGKGLQVLEPLYIYREDGNYCDEILKMYGLTEAETRE